MSFPKKFRFFSICGLGFIVANKEISNEEKFLSEDQNCEPKRNLNQMQNGCVPDIFNDPSQSDSSSCPLGKSCVNSNSSTVCLNGIESGNSDFCFPDPNSFTVSIFNTTSGQWININTLNDTFVNKINTGNYTIVPNRNKQLIFDKGMNTEYLNSTVSLNKVCEDLSQFQGIITNSLEYVDVLTGNQCFRQISSVTSAYPPLDQIDNPILIASDFLPLLNQVQGLRININNSYGNSTTIDVQNSNIHSLLLAIENTSYVSSEESKNLLNFVNTSTPDYLSLISGILKVTDDSITAQLNLGMPKFCFSSIINSTKACSISGGCLENSGILFSQYTNIGEDNFNDNQVYYTNLVNLLRQSSPMNDYYIGFIRSEGSFDCNFQYLIQSYIPNNSSNNFTITNRITSLNQTAIDLYLLSGQFPIQGTTYYALPTFAILDINGDGSLLYHTPSQIYFHQIAHSLSSIYPALQKATFNNTFVEISQCCVQNTTASNTIIELPIYYPSVDSSGKKTLPITPGFFNIFNSPQIEYAVTSTPVTSSIFGNYIQDTSGNHYPYYFFGTDIAYKQNNIINSSYGLLKQCFSFSNETTSDGSKLVMKRYRIETNGGYNTTANVKISAEIVFTRRSNSLLELLDAGTNLKNIITSSSGQISYISSQGIVNNNLLLEHITAEQELYTMDVITANGALMTKQQIQRLLEQNPHMLDCPELGGDEFNVFQEKNVLPAMVVMYEDDLNALMVNQQNWSTIQFSSIPSILSSCGSVREQRRATFHQNDDNCNRAPTYFQIHNTKNSPLVNLRRPLLLANQTVLPAPEEIISLNFTSPDEVIGCTYGKENTEVVILPQIFNSEIDCMLNNTKQYKYTAIFHANEVLDPLFLSSKSNITETANGAEFSTPIDMITCANDGVFNVTTVRYYSYNQSCSNSYNQLFLQSGWNAYIQNSTIPVVSNTSSENATVASQILSTNHTVNLYDYGAYIEYYSSASLDVVEQSGGDSNVMINSSAGSMVGIPKKCFTYYNNGTLYHWQSGLYLIPANTTLQNYFIQLNQINANEINLPNFMVNKNALLIKSLISSDPSWNVPIYYASVDGSTIGYSGALNYSCDISDLGIFYSQNLFMNPSFNEGYFLQSQVDPNEIMMYPGIGAGISMKNLGTANSFTLFSQVPYVQGMNFVQLIDSNLDEMLSYSGLWFSQTTLYDTKNAALCGRNTSGAILNCYGVLYKYNGEQEISSGAFYSESQLVNAASCKKNASLDFSGCTNNPLNLTICHSNRFCNTQFCCSTSSWGDNSTGCPATPQYTTQSITNDSFVQRTCSFPDSVANAIFQAFNVSNNTQELLLNTPSPNGTTNFCVVQKRSLQFQLSEFANGTLNSTGFTGEILPGNRILRELQSNDTNSTQNITVYDIIRNRDINYNSREIDEACVYYSDALNRGISYTNTSICSDNEVCDTTNGLLLTSQNRTRQNNQILLNSNEVDIACVFKSQVDLSGCAPLVSTLNPAICHYNSLCPSETLCCSTQSTGDFGPCPAEKLHTNDMWPWENNASHKPKCYLPIDMVNELLGINNATGLEMKQYNSPLGTANVCILIQKNYTSNNSSQTFIQRSPAVKYNGYHPDNACVDLIDAMRNNLDYIRTSVCQDNQVCVGEVLTKNTVEYACVYPHSLLSPSLPVPSCIPSVEDAQDLSHCGYNMKCQAHNPDGTCFAGTIHQNNPCQYTGHDPLESLDILDIFSHAPCAPGYAIDPKSIRLRLKGNNISDSIQDYIFMPHANWSAPGRNLQITSSQYNNIMDTTVISSSQFDTTISAIVVTAASVGFVGIIGSLVTRTINMFSH